MKIYLCMPSDSVWEESYRLTAVQPGHIESIRRWRNAQLAVLRQDKPISRDQQIAYYDRFVWPSMDDAEPANILVSYLRGDKLVGYGGLVHLDWGRRHAEVSFLLAPIYASQAGVYREHHLRFLRLLKRLAFLEMGFECLTTETFPDRVEHMQNLEASGFSRVPSPPGSMTSFVTRNDSVFHCCFNRKMEI